MQKLLLFLGLSLSMTSCYLGQYPSSGGSGGGTSSPTPGNLPPTTGRSADPGVKVTDIRLTNSYTVIYMNFQDKSQPQYDRNGRLLSSNFIAFHPSGQLVAANGSRTFRFVKAEGIPVEPQRKNTYPGDRVNFVLYFERLDKGLENFDLFECNDYDHIVCWNSYGLYVSNPADPIYTPPVSTPPVSTPPIQKPKSDPSEPPVEAKKPGKMGEVDVPKTEPVPVPTMILISGLVKDAKTKQPISATIDYQLSSSKQSVDSVQSFASTGLYRMNLQKGQVYTFVASAKGYIATNDFVDLTKTSGGQKITKDILLTPLAVGDKVTLKNIYFEMSKSDLLTASYAELNKLVTMMQDNPTMEIRLEGHTDIIGDHDANLQLSKDRVDACRAYLVRQGTASVRIQTIGYGDTRPILTKGTDEERKINRRVEFAVLKL